MGGARTDLTGLTASEGAGAVPGRRPRGRDAGGKGGARKLVHALPEPFRASAEAASSAIVIDPADWDRRPVPPPAHLEVLQRAISDSVQIEMQYGDRAGAESERIVHPLGLVREGPRSGTSSATPTPGMRTFRVGRVRSVRLTDRPLVRPDGFDLEATWQSTLATLDEMRAPFTAVVRADAGIVPVLRSVFGTMLTAGEASDDGRVDVEIRDRTAFMIAVRLAGFGNKVEVVGPDSVRTELARIGNELQDFYA